MADEDPSAENDWGVTVEEVSALAPHVTIGTQPSAPIDPVFGKKADNSITVDEVESWIKDVAGRVSLRLSNLGKISDTDRVKVLAKSAHDAVVNGAASYLVAAAHPIGNVNNDGGYAALLWSRYESALEGVGTTLDGWIIDLPAAVPSGAASGFFPEPMFPDGARF